MQRIEQQVAKASQACCCAGVPVGVERQAAGPHGHREEVAPDCREPSGQPWLLRMSLII